jgi:NADPH:quinone reductase-like Zn-dependent oxidoreductase
MAARTTEVPPTMRAWNFSSAGHPSSVLSLNPSFPTPHSPTGSQLLVYISHAALSSAGFNLMRDVPSLFRTNAIPELDFSGRVVSVGPSAPANFSPGTPVFGTVSKGASVLSGVGTLAEYILIEADCVAVKPSGMSFAEAAGLSSLGQVALEMVRRGHVKEGTRTLVNGGSGGVGMVAVQLVKAMGGYVVATCSMKNVDLVKSLGADEVRSRQT